MKTKITPGEWSVDDSVNPMQIFVKGKPYLIIADVMIKTKSSMKLDETIANAEAIAMVPQMIKSLRAVDKLLTIYSNSTEPSLKLQGVDAEIWKDLKNILHELNQENQ